VDNSAGTGKTVYLKTSGRVILSVSGAAATDGEKAVYASDDDTFTLTQSTNTYVGKIVRYISSGVVLVEFNFTTGAALPLLTGTAALITSAGVTLKNGSLIAGVSTTDLASNIAMLADKLNSLTKIVGGE